MMKLDSIKQAIEARKPWYYLEDGEEIGPVMLREISGMVESGELRPDTLIWSEGMAQWEPASAHVPHHEAGGPHATSTGREPSSGRSLTPKFVLRADDAPQAAASGPGAKSHAKALTDAAPAAVARLLARFIDVWLSSFVLALVIARVAPGKSYLIERPSGVALLAIMVATIAYDSLAAALGIRTIGKFLLNIHVRSTSGGPLSWNEAASRSGLVLFVGLGALIPPLCLLTQVIQYHRLMENGQTGYDRAHGFVVTHGPVDQARGLVTAILVTVLVILSVTS